MTRQQAFVTLLGALAFSTAPTANAAQLGHYLGGFFGATKHQGSVASYDRFALEGLYPVLAFTPNSHIADFDPHNEGYAALIGYRVHRNVAVEAIFGHFGEVEYRSSSDGITTVLVPEGVARLPLSVSTLVTSKVTGLGAYALGIWPINPRWEFYGRAGLQYSIVDTEAHIARTGGTEQGFSSAEAGVARDAAVDLAAGIGMTMSLAEIYGIRLEYLRVFNAGSDAVAKGDSDILSLGIIVAF